VISLSMVGFEETGSVAPAAVLPRGRGPSATRQVSLSRGAEFCYVVHTWPGAGSPRAPAGSSCTRTVWRPIRRSPRTRVACPQSWLR